MRPNVNRNAEPTTNMEMADVGNRKNAIKIEAQASVMFGPILLVGARALFAHLLRTHPRSGGKRAKITPQAIAQTPEAVANIIC